VVHVLVSAQSALVRQHPVLGALPHEPPAAHVSVVQAFESLQSDAAVQQLGIAACWQKCDAPQVSVVHESPSLQSAAVWQQPVIGELTHMPPGVGQLSLVQKFPSLQPVSVRQQFAIGACAHIAEPLHESVVQRFVSSQSIAPLQQPAIGVCEQEPLGSMQASVVQRFVSAQEGGVPGVHVPAMHVLVPLHARPSSHEVPLVAEPSAGHAAPEPSQDSATSQVPTAARH
jgi:hypothetical protein